MKMCPITSYRIQYVGPKECKGEECMFFKQDNCVLVLACETYVLKNQLQSQSMVSMKNIEPPNYIKEFLGGSLEDD